MHDVAQEAAPILRIVGVGGTTEPASSTELVLETAMGHLERHTVDATILRGADLDLPLYRAGAVDRSAKARRLVDAVGAADGIIVASPGYHGTVSGMVKNALDYLEELRGGRRGYLEGRAVGCIALAADSESAVSTLHTLRVVVHALRGWPTPLGVALCEEDVEFGSPEGPAAMQVRVLADQVHRFAQLRAGSAQPVYP